MALSRFAQLTLLGILLITGTTAYFIFFQTSPDSVATQRATHWKTYTHPDQGFTVQYPEEFLLNDGADTTYNVGTFFLTSGKPLVTVRFPDNAFPGTNFFHGFVTVSVNQDIADAPACREYKRDGDTNSLPLPEEIQKNNLIMYSGRIDGAAAGTFAQSAIRHVFTHNQCYEIGAHVFSGNSANYEPGAITLFPEETIWQTLQGILDSFTLPENSLLQ